MYSECFDLFLKGEKKKLQFLTGENGYAFPVNRPLEEEYQLFFQKVSQQFPGIRYILWEDFNMTSSNYFFIFLEFENGNKVRFKYRWKEIKFYKCTIYPPNTKSLIEESETYENNLTRTLSAQDLLYGDKLEILDTQLETGSRLEKDETFVRENYKSILDLLELIILFSSVRNKEGTQLNLNRKNFIHTVELQDDGSFSFDSEASYDLSGYMDSLDPEWDK